MGIHQFQGRNGKKMEIFHRTVNHKAVNFIVKSQC